MGVAGWLAVLLWTGAEFVPVPPVGRPIGLVGSDDTNVGLPGQDSTRPALPAQAGNRVTLSGAQ